MTIAFFTMNANVGIYPQGRITGPDSRDQADKLSEQNDAPRKPLQPNFRVAELADDF